MTTNPDIRAQHAAAAKAAPVTEQRRVAAATVIGTTVEWYDFFIYSAAAALVFESAFFKPAGSTLAPVLSFLTVGISFIFRPLGAVVAGHLGDRFGRRHVLVLTLVMMGLATALIGILPTYGTLGIAAPILLITLRILQGISAGGEWGGAALMAVEHAPEGKRGLYGSGPQAGVPLGLLLSSAMMGVMSLIAPGKAFVEWGWRIPFLLSVVLIFVGYWVRRSVEESPVFQEIADRAEETKAPLLKVFADHWLLIVIAAVIFAGNSAVGYMTTGGFIQRYATNPQGPIHLDKGPVLWVVALSGFTWLVFTVLAGKIADHIGRRTTFLMGFVVLFACLFVMFPLIKMASITSLGAALVLLSFGLGLTYGPLAALYSELFPASLRFSGVSISYALGAVLGGAFAPMIAQVLLDKFHTEWAIVVYLCVMVVLGFLATALLRDRSGIPLGPDHEEEQAVSPIRGLSRV